MKFPVLTPTGEAKITELGITPTSIGNGSRQHEYWKDELAKRCTALGYTVTREYSLGNNRVDLHITREHKTYLIEAEKGKIRRLE